MSIDIGTFARVISAAKAMDAEPLALLLRRSDWEAWRSWCDENPAFNSRVALGVPIFLGGDASILACANHEMIWLDAPDGVHGLSGVLLRRLPATPPATDAPEPTVEQDRPSAVEQWRQRTDEQLAKAKAIAELPWIPFPCPTCDFQIMRHPDNPPTRCAACHTQYPRRAVLGDIVAVTYPKGRGIEDPVGAEERLAAINRADEMIQLGYSWRAELDAFPETEDPAEPEDADR